MRLELAATVLGQRGGEVNSKISQDHLEVSAARNDLVDAWNEYLARQPEMNQPVDTARADEVEHYKARYERADKLLIGPISVGDLS